MRTEKVPEYALSSAQEQEIRQLLDRSFEAYPPDRIHFRQLPDWRLLGYEAEGRLIGHLAVEYRIVNLAGDPIRVFGVVDLCIDPQFRGQHLAGQLLDELSGLAVGSKVDFIILVTSATGFYEPHGFVPVDNPCLWLMIQNDQSLGLVQRRLGPGLMVKATGARRWTGGTLDLLGHIF